MTFDDIEAKPSVRPVSIPLTLPVRGPEAYPLLFGQDTETTAGDAMLQRDRGHFLVNVSPPAGGFATGEIVLAFVNHKAGDGELPTIKGKLTIK